MGAPTGQLPSLVHEGALGDAFPDPWQLDPVMGTTTQSWAEAVGQGPLAGKPRPSAPPPPPPQPPGRGGGGSKTLPAWPERNWKFLSTCSASSITHRCLSTPAVLPAVLRAGNPALDTKTVKAPTHGVPTQDREPAYRGSRRSSKHSVLALRAIAEGFQWDRSTVRPGAQ